MIIEGRRSPASNTSFLHQSQETQLSSSPTGTPCLLLKKLSKFGTRLSPNTLWFIAQSTTWRTVLIFGLKMKILVSSVSQEISKMAIPSSILWPVIRKYLLKANSCCHPATLPTWWEILLNLRLAELAKIWLKPVLWMEGTIFKAWSVYLWTKQSPNPLLKNFSSSLRFMPWRLKIQNAHPS